MPVTSISGIAGTLPEQPSGLQQFGEQLLKARQARREAAQQDLEAASKIAEHDPVLAEEIGGKAIKELGKHKGQGPSEMYFQNIFSEAQKKRQGQEQLQAANIESLKASTAASGASTAASQASTAQTVQQTGFDAAHEQLRVKAQGAEERLAKGEYPDTEEGQAARKGDALTVGLAHNRNAADIKEMGLSPKEAKEVDDELAMMRKRTLGKAQIEYAQALGDMMMQDGKGGLRQPTNKEINDALAGNPPTGMTSQKDFQNIAIKLRDVAANETHAEAAMIDARSRGRLTDAEITQYTAKSELELAQAKALQAKGIKTSYDEILNGLDKLSDAKKKGLEVDPSLTRKMQDDLAAFYGLTPQESKDWLGRMKLRGYVPGPPEGPASSGALSGEAPAKPTSGYEIGKSIPKGIQKFHAAGIKETGELEQFIENIVRGSLGAPEAK